ncbi:Prefoldin subunit 6 [Histomonas meleagridis]|uniref:Prefoldin subunit 6 n=1 Tax=Histomonas meleagridis TaxID=135588 RepID=UPI00355A3220|nr:Prefoldin subunit 6 [Histomonas meleagridis]KAH0796159.1 Prefoldin subunit 6 [Histomonas meleagridis]
MPLDLRALEEAGKSVEEAKANLQTLLEQCTQLFVQQKENEIVLEEFEFLNETDVVMKQVGPTLITQELSEAKQNVQQRLEYIKGQIKTIETKIEEGQKRLQECQQKLNQMQSSIQ